jgi:uncharacterized protein (TIGR04222 family)
MPILLFIVYWTAFMPILLFIVYWTVGIVSITMVAYMCGLSSPVVCTAVAALTVGIAHVIVRDKTCSRPPPPLPSAISPYEIAYLRGGTREVIRTALYTLYQLGFIEVSQVWLGSELVRQAGGHDPTNLSELEKRVLLSFEEPILASGAFRIRKRASYERLTPLCAQFRNKLKRDELLRPANMRPAAFGIGILASGIILYLPPLMAEFDRRLLHNQSLVLMMMFWLVTLWIVVGPAAFDRRSSRGRAYLKRLQVAFADTRKPAAPAEGDAARPGMAPVLSVGLFGVGILRGSSDQAFAAMFADSAFAVMGAAVVVAAAVVAAAVVAAGDRLAIGLKRRNQCRGGPSEDRSAQITRFALMCPTRRKTMSPRMSAVVVLTTSLSGPDPILTKLLCSALFGEARMLLQYMLRKTLLTSENMTNPPVNTAAIIQPDQLS